MKKTASILFILSMLLTACGSTPTVVLQETTEAIEPTQTPEPEATSEVQTQLKVNEDELDGLEITVWYPWYELEASLFETLVKDFNEENEWGIHVNAQGQVNFGNLYEEVNAALPTPGKPDLVIALPEHALEWNEQRVVTDLTPYVEDPLYGIDPGDIPFVFLNQDTIGETRVGMPAQRTARFLLWNETWAGSLGFDSLPDSPDDFKQQACRAHEAMLKDDSQANDFMGGWFVDTDPMTAYAWLLAFEGGVLEGNDYRFLTPNNIEALKFLRELSETTCAWQAAGTSAVDALAGRQALFITASLEDLPAVARAFGAADNRDEWKVIPFPGSNEDALVVYGSSYVILDSTDEKQLASWLFTRWLLDPEQDARWVETTHLFPLRESTLDLLSDYEKSHPQWSEAVELLPKGEIQPQLASWRTVKVMLGDGFTHMFRVNVSSGQVAAILAQMESTSRELSE
jgi:ABC-type glycerol-3-phosphate transport system substrate-binding protein